MKKYILAFVCCALLLVILPISTNANEADVHSELVALAADAFPEYADILLNPTPLAQTRSLDEATEVVFRGTREISDDRQVSITLYQDGNAVIMEESTGFPVEITDSSAGSVSYRVTCSAGTGSFTLNDVEYVAYGGNSGTFTSYGTYSTTRGCAVGSVERESNYMSYALTFSYYGTRRFPPMTTFEVFFRNGSVCGETRD